MRSARAKGAPGAADEKVELFTRKKRRGGGSRKARDSAIAWVHRHEKKNARFNQSDNPMSEREGAAQKGIRTVDMRRESDQGREIEMENRVLTGGEEGKKRTRERLEAEIKETSQLNKHGGRDIVGS